MRIKIIEQLGSISWPIGNDFAQLRALRQFWPSVRQPRLWRARRIIPG